MRSGLQNWNFLEGTLSCPIVREDVYKLGSRTSKHQTSLTTIFGFRFLDLSNNAYSSKCEDSHGITLPEKFSLCLSEFVQNLCYVILRKIGMLHRCSAFGEAG